MDDLFKTIIASGISGGLCGYIALCLQGLRFKSQYERMEQVVNELKKEKMALLQVAIDAKASLEKVTHLEKELAQKASRETVSAIEKELAEKASKSELSGFKSLIESKVETISQCTVEIFDQLRQINEKLSVSYERSRYVRTIEERLQKHIAGGGHHGN